MLFRELREDLLKISIKEFSSEYGVPVNDVETLERTNEVPLALIRQIAKKSGYSIGDLLKYDGSIKPQEVTKVSGVVDSEHQIPMFSIAEKETATSQFDSWLKDNKQALGYSKAVEEWTGESISWILHEYDKSIQNETPNNEKISKRDISAFAERLVAVSQNEIKKLQFILGNRDKSRVIVKNAVNLEVTRLMKEDAILEKMTGELDAVKGAYLKDTHDILEKLTSYQHIEEVLKNNVFEDYLSSEVMDGINKACLKQQNDFKNAIDSIVKRDDGLICFYKTELSGLFADASELNGFSVEDIYHKYFAYGFSHPEEFDLYYTEISDEEKGKREKATKTRRTKEAVWDFATDMLFPPKAIIDVFRAGNKRNIAKELAKFLKEHRKVDDYYNRMSYCYDVVVAAAVYALSGIKKEWKEYFDATIDIVQKDDRAIKKMIEDEKNKIFISKSLKEAFQEDQ